MLDVVVDRCVGCTTLKVFFIFFDVGVIVYQLNIMDIVTKEGAFILSVVTIQQCYILAFLYYIFFILNFYYTVDPLTSLQGSGFEVVSSLRVKFAYLQESLVVYAH